VTVVFPAAVVTEAGVTTPLSFATTVASPIVTDPWLITAMTVALPATPVAPRSGVMSDTEGPAAVLSR